MESILVDYSAVFHLLDAASGGTGLVAVGHLNAVLAHRCLSCIDVRVSDARDPSSHICRQSRPVMGREHVREFSRAIFASLEESDQQPTNSDVAVISDLTFIDFQTYLSYVASSVVSDMETEDLTGVLSELDRDGSGWIPVVELRHDIAEREEAFEEHALAAAGDSEGWINYERYLTMMLGGTGEWQDDSGYVPLRPQVYNLVPSSLHPCVIPALIAGTDIPFVMVCPGVFTFPLLDPAFCRVLYDELRHLDDYCASNHLGGVFRLRSDSIGNMRGSDLTRRSAKAIEHSSQGKRLSARGFGRLSAELALILRPLCQQLFPRLCEAEQGGLERQVSFVVRHWLDARATSAALLKGSANTSVVGTVGGSDRSGSPKRRDITVKGHPGDSSSTGASLGGRDNGDCDGICSDSAAGCDCITDDYVPVFEDDSLVTISVCLNARCVGGRDLYGAARCEKHALCRTSAPQHVLRPLSIQPGQAVVRLGCVEAATEPLAAGERHDLVMWLRHRGVGDGRQPGSRYSESGRCSLNRLLPTCDWCGDCADAKRMAAAALAARLPETVLQRNAKLLLPLPDNVVALVLFLAYS
eukprot:TRINITY_DN46034_c0_g1_i1.p1 TRINITY_DN46034_c0_g1~~TRINITY_DN46034_c0_g1_i1.p1  ORF type:complete len:584 (+),score=89.39 TRINITY_DN46034_c0_g1_i1:78-1829(+)